MISLVENRDCMQAMSEFPDKYFDLAVCDPPYGIGISNNPFRQKHKKTNWDSNIPEQGYFSELMRVSKHQIIWGGNYFGLPKTQGFIIWDKEQPENFSSSMCEYAWMSIQSPAKIFRYKVTADVGKIHPTQKPIKLYDWIFKNYAKDGMKILDTHLGSGSSRISAHKAGLDFWGYELDKDYFEAQEKRFNDYLSQGNLFS